MHAFRFFLLVPAILFGRRGIQPILLSFVECSGNLIEAKMLIGIPKEVVSIFSHFILGLGRNYEAKGKSPVLFGS